MNSVPRSRYILFILLAVGGLTADLISKKMVFERLGAPYQGTDWLLDGWLKFRLYTTFNHGALWGIGQGWTSLFAILSVAAVAGVLYWLFIAKAAHSWWLTTALGLVMAGTLGNLWDRLGMHGSQHEGQPIYAVRDFLHFRFGTFDWAIFNIADVCLVAGAMMLGLQSLRPEPKPASTPAAATHVP